MESAGLPSVLDMLLKTTESMLNGVPIRMIEVYCLAYSIVLTVAPKIFSIGVMNRNPSTMITALEIRVRIKTVPSVFSASSSLLSPSLIAAYALPPAPRRVDMARIIVTIGNAMVVAALPR